MSRGCVHCRPEAFQFFAEQLPAIETTDALMRAAIAISMHALDDVVPQRVDERFHGLAERVRSRVKHQQVDALLAHLHQVLFEEEGFGGNADDFYQPLNSYLPVVLETRRGIPISLSLVYKVVAERMGLRVEGINAPGHFLVRVRTNGGWSVVDPFFGGTALNSEEAFQRIERVLGQPIPRSPKFLKPATHPQWLSRMLANLQNIFAVQGHYDDSAAMNELQSLLKPMLL
jgi:regulator of sirC expression with transglutaminase-like and TPR domain